MREITGAYNTAIVFADTIDESAVSQILTLCNMAFTAGSRIRIMPDAHAGAGCTIGTTMTIADKIVPNLVGVDIGCGMETACIADTRVDLPKLDSLIRSRIPSGMAIRQKPHRYADDIDLSELHCAREVNLDRAVKSIGTLGGGNHFIEADRGEDGKLYIVIHSGSRHIGLEVAKFYQQEAYKQLNGNRIFDQQVLTAAYKAQGRDKEIQQALKELKKQVKTDIPFVLAYAEGDLFHSYVQDMKIIQHYASLNRQAMMDEIVKGMKLSVADSFTTIHNYIDTQAMILRKGAVSAKAGERLLIPINMRDGSLICTGLGNDEWNQSAPHGAGRLFSRTEAKQRFTVNEFKKQMEGVFTTSIGKETLDECPMAYKGMEEIMRSIHPTAKIEQIIKPIYNFKAGEE